MEMKFDQDSTWSDSPIQKVLVLGGGSAGFLAAITLKIWKKGEAFNPEHLKSQAA